MNSRYFSEQAQKYDFSDFNQPSRKAYINKVDQLIASDMSGIKISKHLDIAVGTGRRAIHIKKLSGLRYEIIGVEISEEMCKIANSRGLRTYHQDWANDDAHIGEMFDSATFLYAFGHIANRNKRLKSLKKIHSYLNEGCPIYLDLFSLTNKNEWGPFAVKAFEKNKLDKHGYERGDVFYKKRGFKELAFLHYFEMNEIEQLFKETGFEIKWIKYLGYSKNSGKLVNSEKEGNFLIKAIKIT
jgi:ubiquinone/menaquinone biosynthesis C-methylase UbiE